MRPKKRIQESSEESDHSAESIVSSSSDSESEESSASERRYKKKRKRPESSESESESDDQKRKKRKHKKKKKKHGKKKRRISDEDSNSQNDASSISEGEISKKKRKHKHKHSKRSRQSSVSEDVEEHGDRRLHSVVKERRASSEEVSHPARTYYQKEYRNSASGEDYDREREVQRFYRGSSKDRRQYQEQYQYDRDRNDRYASYNQDKYYRNKERFNQNSQYSEPNQDFGRRQQDYDEYKRHPKFEHQRPQEDYRRKPREDNYYHKEETRGYGNRYNQYEDKGPKRRVYEESRSDYRERRPPGEAERYREKEYPERRDKYRDEEYPERPRDDRRDRSARPDKPLDTRDRSSEDRYRNRRDEHPRDREPLARGGDRLSRPGDRSDRPGDRPDRSGDRPGDRPNNRSDRPESRPDRSDARPERSDRPKERKSRFADADDKEYSWGKTEVKKEGQTADKEKPNFGLSGKLTADANTVNGVVIKYSEPDDAKQPKRRWRFYPFKGDKALPILYIHRQSAFLIGRDKKVADISLEHPSISKQHAALQYRATPFTRPDGSQGRRVRPYIIDLDSANGTFVNNKKIEPRRYVELLERDVVKFGFSQREYVLLHENSKDDAQDDDQEPGLGAQVTTTDQIKAEKRVKQEIVEDGE
ncbi:probable serine/threonine-protein kinase DDB_G0280133 isoform X1 [Amyelois transitella]|uniref:probable serine/threonine-protein kinase DDB_G0280133 isoform X1 n=1 Tax=Amyelois transitella TaxID=680683 RepID=UPI00298F3E82|nr:probable serine/threonine-protein kinase DDB_G0280133 isoform X1 [Amyelois transitella]